MFIGKTDVEAETPILWPSDVNSWLIWKDSDAGKYGKYWGQEEKWTTENEMVWWHHWLSGHGFGWTSGVCDGQGGLACCSAWGRKELDMTEWLNWTESVMGLHFKTIKILCYVYFTTIRMTTNINIREFPGGLVVRILGFHCCSLGSVPGERTKILQAMRHRQKQTNTRIYISKLEKLHCVCQMSAMHACFTHLQSDLRAARCHSLGLPLWLSW